MTVYRRRLLCLALALSMIITLIPAATGSNTSAARAATVRKGITLVDKVKPGSVYISAKPESTSEKQIRAVYDMIKTGYKAIAEEYPQYITIKEE